MPVRRALPQLFFRHARGIGIAAQRLRPVQFRYIAPFADDRKPIQYGFIAEEAEEVLPELVACGAEWTPGDGQ